MHEKPLSQWESRQVANYLEETYRFRVGKTSLARLTPAQVSERLSSVHGLSVDAGEIRQAARRQMSDN